MKKFFTKNLPLVSFLLSLVIFIALFKPLLFPLLDGYLNFAYGDFSSNIGVSSGLEKYRMIYYVFNERLGAPTLHIIRSFLLEGSITALTNLISTITDSQITSVAILVSIILGCYGILKLSSLFEAGKSRRAMLVLVITLFYYLNLWSVERLAHIWIWVAYAIFPLYLYFGLAYISNRRLKNLIIYSLLFAIYGIIPHNFIYMFIIHTFLTISSIFLFNKKAKNLLLFIGGPIIIYFFMNMPLLLLHMFKGLEYPIPMSIDQLSMLSRNGNLINIFTFSNNWWPKVPATLLKNPLFRVTSLLLFMFTFAILISEVSQKKHKALVLPSAVFVIGLIFFIQGTNNPLLYNIIHIFGQLGYIDLFAPLREWGRLSILLPIFLIMILLLGLSSLRGKKSSSLTFLLLALIIMNVVSSPSLVYINDVYSPTYMPLEYYDMKDKILLDHKVLWIYPSSAQKILGTWRYVWNDQKSISKNLERSIGSTHNIGLEYVKMLTRKEGPQQLLDDLNIKYIIKRTDILGASNFRVDYQYLNCNKLNYLTICENPRNLTLFYIPKSLILSDLDGENFYTITFPQFPFHIAVITECRDDVVKAAQAAILDFESLCLYAKASKVGVILAPFKFTYFVNPARLWSKSSTADLLHADWHPYLEKFGIENWQSDYSEGLVFTWAVSTLKDKTVALEIPFTIHETDEYVFLIRLFQNQRGGSIQIQLDNKSYTINTKDQLNKFVWKQIDVLHLEKGSHRITLINIGGLNAINLFALIPKQEYQNVQNQIEQLLQDKRIIYVLEAESDLYYQNSIVSNKYGGEASNGKVLELNLTSKVWGEIEIIKPGSYTLGIRSKGNLTININEKKYEVSSPQLKWIYIGPINLEKGRHMIEVINALADLDVIWLYSVQNNNETLEDIFAPKENPAEVISYQKIDPTKYVVKVNATKPFMLSFAESYDSLWVAYVNGERIQSMPLYGVINGFWINQTGLLEITIEYEPQKWFYIGLIVSITTLIACTTYLVYDWVREKSILERKKSLKLKIIFHKRLTVS